MDDDREGKHLGKRKAIILMGKEILVRLKYIKSFLEEPTNYLTDLEIGDLDEERKMFSEILETSNDIHREFHKKEYYGKH